jgi:hypothetical protein
MRSEAWPKLFRDNDEAYAELNEGQQAIAEKLFKGLTEKGTDNREIRRPIEGERFVS